MSTSLHTPAESGSKIVNEFSVTIEQLHDYDFRVHFDKPQYQELEMDEPVPLGKDRAPNAARLLSAAIGNCLSASLVFCARKARVELGPVRTVVTTRIARNEKGRLRIAGVDVQIDPSIPKELREQAMGCLRVFEDYCVVTQSVRQGIDVRVNVLTE